MTTYSLAAALVEGTDGFVELGDGRGHVESNVAHALVITKEAGWSKDESVRGVNKSEWRGSVVGQRRGKTKRARRDNEE